MMTDERPEQIRKLELLETLIQTRVAMPLERMHRDRAAYREIAREQEEMNLAVAAKGRKQRYKG